MSPPPAAEYGQAPFQLVDQAQVEGPPGFPPPKQICCIDVTNNPIPPASNPHILSNGELMTGTVTFRSLVLKQCPLGASFEIDIA
jgi:hypothetical protein